MRQYPEHAADRLELGHFKKQLHIKVQEAQMGNARSPAICTLQCTTAKQLDSISGPELTKTCEFSNSQSDWSSLGTQHLQTTWGCQQQLQGNPAACKIYMWGGFSNLAIKNILGMVALSWLSIQTIPASCFSGNNSLPSQLPFGKRNILHS